MRENRRTGNKSHVRLGEVARLEYRYRDVRVAREPSVSGVRGLVAAAISTHAKHCGEVGVEDE